MPVIPATPKAKAVELQLQGQPRQLVETLSQNKITKRAGGVALLYIGPVFNPLKKMYLNPAL